MGSIAVEATLGGLCCVSGAALGTALSSLLGQLISKRNEEGHMPRRSKRYQLDEDNDEEETGAPPARSRRPSAKSNIPGADAQQMAANIANWQGFSMEEAREHCMSGAAKAEELSPQAVLQDLQKGNTRFFQGVAQRPELNAFHRRALIVQQYPKVAVLGCSDSRVPVEIVFDQGLGAMFVVRVAGNCLDTTTKASLQYAVCHLKVKVLIVMGHEGCGAVKAAQLPASKIQNEPTELATALTMLKEGLDEHRLSQVHDSRAHDREAVVTNVLRQVEGLTTDAHIMSRVRLGELIVIGAFYEISSGIVDFFFEVTDTPERESDSLSHTPVNEGVSPSSPDSQDSRRIKRSDSHIKGQRILQDAPHEGVQSRLACISSENSWSAEEFKRWKASSAR